MNKIASFFLLLAFLFSQTARAADFKPAWWCRGAHAQTIAAGLFRKSPDVPLVRERLEMPDGDFVDVDWLEGPADAPYFVVLHGFGGSSRSPHVMLLLNEIRRAGKRAVAINARGTEAMNRLPAMNSGGETGDLDFVVGHLIEAKKAKTIFLVGYSMGGNRLLKWLGEKGDALPAQVKMAAAVSAPYDLEKTAENMDRGFNNRVYAHRLLEVLKAKALEKENKFPGILDRDKTAAASTFAVYDREVSAKLNGFKDERDYWAKCSASAFLDKIRRPVLLVHADNDPFLPERDLPLARMNAPPFTLVLTRDGGHLGFVSQDRRWLEKTLLSFFNK